MPLVLAILSYGFPKTNLRQGQAVPSGSPRCAIKSLRSQEVEPANAYHYQRTPMQGSLRFARRANKKHTRSVETMKMSRDSYGRLTADHLQPPSYVGHQDWMREKRNIVHCFVDLRSRGEAPASSISL